MTSIHVLLRFFMRCEAILLANERSRTQTADKTIKKSWMTQSSIFTTLLSYDFREIISHLASPSESNSNLVETTAQLDEKGKSGSRL
jgi:hypothetical protein